MPTVLFDDLSVHEKRSLVVRAALRTIITVALVVAVYFLAPMDRANSAAAVAELVLGVLVLSGSTRMSGEPGFGCVAVEVGWAR